MKKHNCKYVNLIVHIPRTNKKLKFYESEHTVLQELVIEICKKLDYDRFNTNISFTDINHKQLSLTKSMKQITGFHSNHFLIFAKFTSTSAINKASLDGVKTLNGSPYSVFDQYVFKNSKYPDFVTKTNDQFFDRSLKEAYCEDLNEKMWPGLNVIASCVNKKCIAYKRIKVMNLGTGNFDLLHVFDTIDCPECPNKAVSKKSMYVFRTILKECMWNIDGYVKLDKGPTMYENVQNKRFSVETHCDYIIDQIFNMVKRKGYWKSLKIEIRNLVQAKFKPEPYSNFEKYLWSNEVKKQEMDKNKYYENMHRVQIKDGDQDYRRHDPFFKSSQLHGNNTKNSYYKSREKFRNKSPLDYHNKNVLLKCDHCDIEENHDESYYRRPSRDISNRRYSSSRGYNGDRRHSHSNGWYNPASPMNNHQF